MKNILLATLILLEFTLYSQNIGFNLYSQNKITITFADGSKIKGYGRVKMGDKIRYKKNKNSKKKIFSYDTKRKVRKFTVHTEETDRYFEYKIVQRFKRLSYIKLLEVEKFGKVKLYKYTGTYRVNSFATDGIGGFGGMRYSKTKYYISKNNSIRVRDLRIGNTYSRRFRRIAKRYFSDCTDLMKKIKSREYFDRYDIFSVVDYYNDNCN